MAVKEKQEIKPNGEQAKKPNKKSKKNKKWIKFRHKVVRNVLYVLLVPYILLRYRIKVERLKNQEKRPYLILLNHQTPFDQFFTGMAFKGPVYYLATEDIFSNGWVSSVIRFLLAPIPIKKQTTDVKSILNCIRVANEGGTICIAPEGNRTYSGRTEYMNPAVVTFAKKLKLPVALFRIEGGYGAEPRWSDVVRKGKMRAYFSRVISPEEVQAMSNDELLSAIEEGLYVNEAVADGEYKHKKCAEYLERAVYVCPYCGLSSFHSEGDIIKCKKCGRQIRYTSTKELEGVGFEFPFRFVADWYDYQSDFINKLDVRLYDEAPMYTETVNLSEVIPCKTKKLIAKGATLSLYGNRITAKTTEQEFNFNFSETPAVTVLGRNKLNIYHGGKIYQVKGGKRFNSLKYVHIYHRNKNIVKGNENDTFLGL